jgi:UDP-N-acetylmuramoyl-tripeptide--D-alanyl-D-alanine ligase
VSRWRGDVTDTPSGVTVVNDAYNANPGSMVAALDTLCAMTRETGTRGARRAVAVLGEMLELGDMSVQEHEEIGRTAVRLGVDRLVVVGEGDPIRAMSRAATAAGGSVVDTPDSDSAIEVVRDLVQPGDVVLVKASRSIGLERVALAVVDAGSEATS